MRRARLWLAQLTVSILVFASPVLAQTNWWRTYGGSGDDEGYSVQQTTDGGYVVAGYTASFGAGDTDAYLIKTNASGDTLWTRTYGGTNSDWVNSVQPTSDGGYIVAGQTGSFGAGGGDVYLIKTDADGNVGVAEPTVSREPKALSRATAAPNPFASFTRIPGHESERFSVYDISGKLVGTYRGNRIGEGLLPAVYFIKGPETGDGRPGSLRVVKAK